MPSLCLERAHRGVRTIIRFWNSRAIQGLGLGTFTAGACVQSLVGELRFRKPRGKAKKKLIIMIIMFFKVTGKVT